MWCCGRLLLRLCEQPGNVSSLRVDEPDRYGLERMCVTAIACHHSKGLQVGRECDSPMTVLIQIGFIIRIVGDEPDRYGRERVWVTAVACHHSKGLQV
jgi:hypothetical protein